MSMTGRARATGVVGWMKSGICASITIQGDWLGVKGVGEGNGVSQQRGYSRRLDSSLPSLSNLTSHHLFLMHLAGGEHGGGDSAGCDSAG
jgi:hypothetical protein